MATSETQRTAEELRIWARRWGRGQSKDAALKIADLTEAGEATALTDISTLEDSEMANATCALLRNIARMNADSLLSQEEKPAETRAGMEASHHAIMLMTKK